MTNGGEERGVRVSEWDYEIGFKLFPFSKRTFYNTGTAHTLHKYKHNTKWKMKANGFFVIKIENCEIISFHAMYVIIQVCLCVFRSLAVSVGVDVWKYYFIKITHFSFVFFFLFLFIRLLYGFSISFHSFTCALHIYVTFKSFMSIIWKEKKTNNILIKRNMRRNVSPWYFFLYCKLKEKKKENEWAGKITNL